MKEKRVAPTSPQIETLISLTILALLHTLAHLGVGILIQVDHLEGFPKLWLDQFENIRE
jgi:hypothetical protein